MKEIENLKQNYKELFGADAGEKILEDLRLRFWIEGTTYTPDSNETAYREGQRSVVLFIQHMLRDDNKRLKEMQNNE